ncbi:MAG: hypothetical protein PUK24_00840 [Elusimicrobia bacterium]|nr:hypothetical protein [Elusimicrobiota bacterium]MDY6038878.1 hypothetical protein [Elusimicrobiaceae bacterium]
MAFKFSLINLFAFLLLGGAVYLWGPGWGSLWRAAGSVLLYAAVFGACFVVVKRR